MAARSDSPKQSTLDENRPQKPGSRRPRVLVVATLHWAATTRLALALAKQGFDVGVAAPADHALHRLPAIDTSFVINSHWATARAIANAILGWRPDLVVPGDEDAIRHLHTLHDEAAKGRGSNPRRIGALIRNSLGDPCGFPVARKKSAFTEFAQSEGLETPRTVGVDDLDALRRRLTQARFPQVLKLDGGFGGQDVRIVHDLDEAERAFAELEGFTSWSSTMKRAAKYLSIEPLRDRIEQGKRSITMQDFVEGTPANRAVLCWQGEILAGLSVEALRTNNATGPATVVRVVDYAGMARTAAHVVRRLGLSGFVGFDFVVEAGTGRSFVIEMNARPTQTCHLALAQESDMVGALFAKLAGTGRADFGRRQGCEVIAFFPQEIWRDPDSEHLRTAFHDVPWDEPQYVQAYARPVPVTPPTWVDRVRRHWTRFKAIADSVHAPGEGRSVPGRGSISKTVEPGW